VHRPPARVGGNDVAVAGVHLPCNQIAGWNNRAVGERTEAMFEKGVKPSEIVQKPVVKVRNPEVDAVPRCRAAGAVRVPQAEAEAAVIEAVDHHWRIRRESGAVGLHLRENDGDGGGGEDPAPFRDGLGQHPKGSRRIGELVSIASPDEEGRKGKFSHCVYYVLKNQCLTMLTDPCTPLIVPCLKMPISYLRINKIILSYLILENR
jgi:hypothetical protein